MAKSKQIRQRGKLKLSQYFKTVTVGDTVSIVPELGVKRHFPERMCGKSGTVIGFRGEFVMFKAMDGNREKVFIIHPVHLKRLRTLADSEVKVKKAEKVVKVKEKKETKK